MGLSFLQDVFCLLQLKQPILNWNSLLSHALLIGLPTQVWLKMQTCIRVRCGLRLRLNVNPPSYNDWF